MAAYVATLTGRKHAWMSPDIANPVRLSNTPENCSFIPSARIVNMESTFAWKLP